jgi:O-antigen/teichoic acid export membrane protein
LHSALPCYLLLFGVWISSLGWLAQTYLVAADLGATIARIRLFEIVPYIAAAALLTLHFGATGAAIAWSARTALDALAYFVLGWRAIRLPPSPLSEHGLRCVLLLAMLALAVVVIGQATAGLPARAGYAAALLAGYGVVLWRMVLADSERALMRGFASSLNPLRR